MEVDRNFSEALHAITIALNDKIAAVVTKAQQVLENLLNQTTGINSNSTSRCPKFLFSNHWHCGALVTHRNVRQQRLHLVASALSVP